MSAGVRLPPIKETAIKIPKIPPTTAYLFAPRALENKEGNATKNGMRKIPVINKLNPKR